MRGQFSQKDLLEAEAIAERVGLTTTAYHLVDEEYNASWIKVHEEGDLDNNTSTSAENLEELKYKCSNQIQADTYNFLND